MKKIVVVVFALLLSLNVSWAQDAEKAGKPKKSPEQRSEMFVKRMTKELTLNPEQLERVKSLNLDRFKNIDEAKAAGSNDKRGLALKVKAINETFDTNLKGVLTPEQFTKYLTMKAEMKEKGMSRREARK